MISIIKKITLTHSGGPGVIRVTPSFVDGTYFALDTDFTTSISKIASGESATYGVYFKGSDVPGTYTDTLILSNTTGDDLMYSLEAEVREKEHIPDGGTVSQYFWGHPAFNSTIDFGKVLPLSEFIINGSEWKLFYPNGKFQPGFVNPMVHVEKILHPPDIDHGFPWYEYTGLQSIWLNSYTPGIGDSLGSTGYIKSVAFWAFATSDVPISWSIGIKYTPLDGESYATGTPAGVLETGFTTVYQSITDETILSVGWWTFPFSQPFEYNGIENLMIESNHSAAIYPDIDITDPFPQNGIQPIQWIAKMQKDNPAKSNTYEIVITNDTKESVAILAPTFSTGTYFAIDTNFNVGDAILHAGESVKYGIYFIGSVITNETYSDELTFVNSYGDDVVYHLLANTIAIPYIYGGDITVGNLEGETEEIIPIIFEYYRDIGSTISFTGVSITGANADLFDLVTPFTDPITVIALQKTPYFVKFLGSGSIGTYTATFTFTNEVYGDVIYNVTAGVISEGYPDNFANAKLLSEPYPITATHDNTAATAEPGEPGDISFDSPYKTLWFRWTPTESANITLAVSADNLSMYMGVGLYIGTIVSDLTPITAAYGYSPASVDTSVTGGTEYHISIDSYRYLPSGLMTLTISKIPVVGDNFAEAIGLYGTPPIIQISNNYGTTLELAGGEQKHTLLAGNYEWANRTIWYSWNPDIGGDIKLSILSNEGDYPSAALYSGVDLSSLTRLGAVNTGYPSVGITFDSDPIPIISGNQYYIAVGFMGDTVGSFTLTISPFHYNDNFIDAELLSGTLPITKIGNNIGATFEGAGGEQQHTYVAGNWYDTFHTVWYKWDADLNGDIKLSITNTSQPDCPSAALYSGADLSSLTRLGVVDTYSGYYATRYSGSITVAIGTTYYIAVGFKDYSEGGFTLTIEVV